MPRPWLVLDSVETKEGLLELRQRGEQDFMILVGGRVLMTSMIATSERALAEEACQRLASVRQPRLLIGGLGLGMTLRAALDGLPKDATIEVVDLNEKVIDWCRGPAQAASRGAALDPRARLIHGDVTDVIGKVAERQPGALKPWDAIIWDLYVGPKAQGGDRDPLYGAKSTARAFKALKDGGVFGVWGEVPSPAYLGRLKQSGFDAKFIKTRGGGLHHAVFLGEKPSTPRMPKAASDNSGPRRPKRAPKR